MKRLLLAVLFAGGLVVSLSAQQVITRFAVIDMNRIVALYTDKAALNAYNEKRETIQAEIERQNKELQELKDKLEEAKTKKGSKKKQLLGLEDEIAEKTQALKTYIETMRAELENDREQMQKRVNLTQINNAVRYVAESEGVSMVVSKEDQMIIWCSPSIDITVKVINRITGR
jgi:outer membrane protein